MSVFQYPIRLLKVGCLLDTVSRVRALLWIPRAETLVCFLCSAYFLCQEGRLLV